MEITQFENELTNNKANISLISQVIEATENFTKILYIDEIKEKYPRLWWDSTVESHNFSIIFTRHFTSFKPSLSIFARYSGSTSA